HRRRSHACSRLSEETRKTCLQPKHSQSPEERSDFDGDIEGEVDELYDEAVKIVVEMGKASTSVLQRRLRIGSGRAASLLDAMERDGIIGPPDGTKPRAVLVNREDYLRE